MNPLDHAIEQYMWAVRTRKQLAWVPTRAEVEAEQARVAAAGGIKSLRLDIAPFKMLGVSVLPLMPLAVMSLMGALVVGRLMLVIFLFAALLNFLLFMAVMNVVFIYTVFRTRLEIEKGTLIRGFWEHSLADVCEVKAQGPVTLIRCTNGRRVLIPGPWITRNFDEFHRHLKALTGKA